MPEISRFFGIVIAIYYDDHEPPHFHARYGNQRAIIEIVSLAILQGALSPRALGLIMEWASLHKTELMTNWNLAREHAPLQPIPPLE